MAYHAHFFGPNSHFVFHDAGGVDPAVRAVLEPWVKAGWATVEDIRAQAEYDGYYYNQFLVVNDCLHRYRHAANWTFFFDVDEYLYLPNGQTLQSVLGKLSRYTQFTIEQNPMSSKLCTMDPRRTTPGNGGLRSWSSVILSPEYAEIVSTQSRPGMHMPRASTCRRMYMGGPPTGPKA
uniref:Glycosyltransferase family 92 protein n=1 Tax=Ananas comosus var. bracteatus TaxID=296719 RepID=A0A6V7QR55_ANACO